ncbi:MAG: cytochrome c oxidase subunit 3 [Flavobacteriaceae bacterium]|nr:cytochrome c oxidase subunit 3 [Flavobacteriaceae bacterium]
MGATHTVDITEPKPFGISYGKMMMWFFILSDALTFSGFITAYAFSRFKFIESWPLPDEVFNHFPFMHGDNPMYFVALMTFILIFSSVTMVLAVDAGHKMQQKKVILYMFLTIIGGAMFVGSQAWEWKNFISGHNGAVITKGGNVLQFVKADSKKERVSIHDLVDGHAAHGDRVQHESKNGLWFVNEAPLPEYTKADIVKAFNANPNVVIKTETIVNNEKVVLSREDSAEALKDMKNVVFGANLLENEYGKPLFADFFFFITGFHGFHVFSGIVFNIIIFFNIILGTYERRGHYEMVEKVGLYWHFVDLVWVFVFTFFYLV